jgi:hypothetical protein
VISAYYSDSHLLLQLSNCTFLHSKGCHQ